MLLLKAKFLEARELPAADPYPPSVLVAVLAGTDTLHLVARRDLLGALQELEPFTEVAFRLRWRRIDLSSLGGTGRGKAYRLSISGFAEDEGVFE
jgi:hypothetical protein